MNHLNKMTVKELREIAKRIGIVGYSRLPKMDLIEDIKMNIRLAHTEALDVDAEMSNYICQLCGETVKVIEQPSHMIENHVPEAGKVQEIPTYKVGEVVFQGANAELLIAHDNRMRRYNPTLQRRASGKLKGYVILTPKQRRRVQKNLRKHATRLGL